MNGQERSDKLLAELSAIVDTYSPDCIGLCEVLWQKADLEPFVFTFLKSRGYKYTHFALASPINHEWNIGGGLVSRLPLRNIEEIELGSDTFARVERGFSGYKVYAIGADVELSKNQSIPIIVAHPHALKPRSLRTHWQHQKALRTAISKDRYQPVIIGGDFNEPNFLPASFTAREKNRLNHKTGTIFNPTWRYNYSALSWLRFNLDKILWTKNSIIELQEFKILPTRVSDHSPLLARFKIN